MKKAFLVTILCLSLVGVASAQLWRSQDIGTPTAGGSVVVHADGSISVSGDGDDIWNAADSFHFAFVELHGDDDIEITARIVSFSGGSNVWRKFGVMIRDDLTAGSRHAFMAGSADEGVRWQGRRDPDTANCGNAPTIPGSPDPSASVPWETYWVRLARKNGLYYAYGSPDGVNWILAPENNVADGTGEHILNPHPFAMTSPVYVGLAVTSHETGVLTTATFDNVTLKINGIPFWGAHSWDPAPEQKDVPVGVYPLTWDALAPEGHTIRDFKVYFSTSIDDIDPNNPNVENFLIGGGPVTEMTVDSPVLLSDQTYYWRVASYINDSNYMDGLIMSFSTVRYAPVITGQPQDTRYGPACSAVLTVEAKPNVEGEGGPITYQWFKVGDANGLPDETSDTFVTNVPGEYYVVVSNDAGSVQSAAAKVAASVHPKPGAGDGKAYYERFAATTADLAGARSLLTEDPTSATMTLLLDKTEWGRDDGDGPDNYRARFTTWLMPTETGTYQFRLSTDDFGVLWLSSNADPANAVEIASVDGWSDIDQWNKYASQTSQPIELQAGLVYFLRGGHTEGSGGDHIHVQWKTPSADWADITGGVMNSFMPDQWAVRDIEFAPVDINGWLDYNAENITVTWKMAQYGPCDAVYRLYIESQDAGVPETLAYEGTDLTATIPSGGMLAHDQMWYYRIDVTSAADADTERGQTFSISTIKWVPEISAHPKDLNVVKAGSDLTLTCVATALNDDAAALTQFHWYRQGLATPVFTGVPTEISRDGKRYYDCSITLTIEDVEHEGFYYCVAENENGTAQSNAAKVLTERLMVHYTFDSLNGTTVPDSSPTGEFDGVLKSVRPADLETGEWPGVATIVPGMIGGAIDLVGGRDPNSAYVATDATPFDLGIRGALPRSVSVWARTRSMARSGVYAIGTYSQSMQFFGLHNENNEGGNYIYQFDHWGSNFNYTDWSAFGTWVHIVHIYDGANVRIYVDGVKVADYAPAEALNTQVGGETPQPLAIGFWGSIDAAFQHAVFDGQIDDFRLYNYALSPVEVGQLWVLGGGAGGCMEQLAQDFNGDCAVDLADFAELAAHWMESSLITP